MPLDNTTSRMSFGRVARLSRTTSRSGYVCRAIARRLSRHCRQRNDGHAACPCGVSPRSELPGDAGQQVNERELCAPRISHRDLSAPVEDRRAGDLMIISVGSNRFEHPTLTWYLEGPETTNSPGLDCRAPAVDRAAGKGGLRPRPRAHVAQDTRRSTQALTHRRQPSEESTRLRRSRSIPRGVVGCLPMTGNPNRPNHVGDGHVAAGSGQAQWLQAPVP